MTPSAPPPKRWRLVPTVWAILAIVMTSLILQCFQEDQSRSGTYGCEMSYMWPTYHQVDWPYNPSSKYSLWLYREQGWDRDMRPNGHPIIFVPGNAGSFKQVRSIASSAARQYYTESGGRASGMEDKTSLDLFAVDYNEDFSAFHAATLREQAVFLAHSVRHVLEQYSHLPTQARPEHVTLLGHSMGGIAARLASEELPGLIDVILTMSTPHAIPPVTLEVDMDKIWKRLDRQYHNDTSPLLLSICGGTADTQIASDACVIPQNTLGTDNGFTVFTTGMPGTWTSVEHQAMVWCHQIRWRVARTLLDMTARSRRQDKLAVAKEWLLGQYQTTDKPQTAFTRVSVTAASMSTKVLSQAYDWTSTFRWCKTEGDCHTVSAETSLLPAPSDIKAPFPLPGEGVKPEEQVVVLDLQLDEATGWLELPGERVSYSSGRSVAYKTRSGSWHDSGEPASSHLKISFEGVSTSSLLVHRLDLHTQSCQGHRPTLRYRSAPTSRTPNVYEARFFPNAEKTTFLHSHSTSAPFIASGSTGLTIDVYQEPDCQVTSAKLSIAYGASLAKMVTRFRMLAVGWIAGWTAAAISVSIGSWQRTGTFTPLSSSLDVLGRQNFLLFTGLLVLGFIAGLITSNLGELVLAPLVIVVAAWTFAVVNLVNLLLDLLLAAPSLILSSKLSSGSRVPIPLRSVALTALPALGAVHFLIPHQMAFMILLVIWLAVTATEDPNSGRFHFMASMGLFMMTLVPFNAPALAVWGRNVWADFRHPHMEDHNVFRILPLLVMVSLHVSGRTLKPKRGLAEVAKYAFLAFAGLAFTFGPRRTWIVPYMADIVFIELALLMVD